MAAKILSLRRAQWQQRAEGIASAKAGGCGVHDHTYPKCTVAAWMEAKNAR
jgi:hypothetical protein